MNNLNGCVYALNPIYTASQNYVDHLSVKDTTDGMPSRPNHNPGSNSILSTSCSG